MEQVMNNEDLLRIIYSFGYPKHREYIKEIVSTFHYKHSKRNNIMTCLKYDWNLYASNNPHYSTMDSFMSDLLSEKEQEYILRQMIQCRCCTRHSHNKPIMVDKTFYYKQSNKRYYNDVDCKCSCRNLSRQLWHSLTGRVCRHRYKDITIFMTPRYIKI